MSFFNTVLKRSFAIIIGSIILGFTLISAIESFVNEYPEGTFLGPVDLSGKSKTDVRNDVLFGINDYTKEFFVTVEFNNRQYTLPANVISYDLADSLDLIRSGKKSFVAYDINTEMLLEEIGTIVDDRFIDLIDITALESRIKSNLIESVPFASVNLHDYIVDYTVIWEPINTYTYRDLSGEDRLADFEDITFSIPAHDRFSFLSQVPSLFLDSEELSILATGIQAVTIESNFEAFIKTTHRTQTFDEDNMRDIYDVYINVGQKKDFSFYNPYNYEYQIDVRKVGNTLEFTLIGIPFTEEYTFKVVSDEVPYLTKTGSVATEGENGLSVEIIRYIVRDDVQYFDKSLYTNYYAPTAEVIEVAE